MNRSRTDNPGSATPTRLSAPRVVPRSEHSISRKDISPGALKVLYRLNEAGFDAFIVGGGIRDLLLGLTPKDFDVATNASPEEVKDVFGRNARLIGRRFRIVHVRFGREITEVSTFRSNAAASTEIDGESLPRKVTDIDSAHSQSGMILRDNVYGSIEDDALRRDFTVNALYYTVRNFEVHDYVGGLEDIAGRTLRMIGEPEQRYREDPVRVLRAIRLAAKLDFSIDSSTEEPIQRCATGLQSVPPARLFDEFLKLFFTGHALETWRRLNAYRVFDVLFPESTAICRENPVREKLQELAFDNTDQRIRDDKSVTPAFLLAAIMWPAVFRRFEANRAGGLPPVPAMHQAGQDVVGEQIRLLSIPKRFSIPMREIWEFQLRLERRRGKRADTLMRHKRFRAAYDFLLLREAAGEETAGLGQWWTDYQDADAAGRKAMQAELQKPRHSKSRKRKVKSGKGHAGNDPAGGLDRS